MHDVHELLHTVVCTCFRGVHFDLDCKDKKALTGECRGMLCMQKHYRLVDLLAACASLLQFGRCRHATYKGCILLSEMCTPSNADRHTSWAI